MLFSDHHHLVPLTIVLNLAIGQGLVLAPLTYSANHSMLYLTLNWYGECYFGSANFTYYSLILADLFDTENPCLQGLLNTALLYLGKMPRVIE